MANGQSADFQRLIERRRKFIDGLDANRGEINLDIFEDFYPDKAHFVYELLQNAEDAGAKAITFTLMQDKLICEHDGRPFTIEDVTSITGLHDSTKAKAQDKIGKFGVGFKSVFVYTKAPAIYSNDFAFRIVELILPEPLTPDASLGKKTRFEFPFDSPKKPATDAYAEIAEGLDVLDEKTLLFLSSLQSVRWRIGDSATGEVLRIQHSDFHFEVLKEAGGTTTSSSHFLKFDEVVQGLGQQRVAVAFPLDALPGVALFDEKKPLADQFKIVPASPGSVAVFFLAAKETSGLRFHLHGPFVPELSRASIKDTLANLPLFEQLATLAAYALHGIKKLGLLTTEFLAVLPNPQDQIPERYEGIRTVIVEEMNAEPLTPMYGGGHAPANRLLQARASLKTLLSEEDIEFLVDYDDEPPLWVVGAAQRNSRIDNFLAGLNIRDWGLEEFIYVLSDKLDDQPLFDHVPDEDYLDWLAQKTPEWMQELYALLNAEAREGSHLLNTLRIVRLNDGELSRADSAFFAAESTISSLSAVDKAVYSSGTSKRQQEDAKALLALIGVREVGEAEEIEIILKSRYTEEAEVLPDDVYLDDLRRFVGLVEKQPEKAKLFAGFYVLQGEGGLWYTPGGIYLDEPFMDTGLSVYFDAIPEDEQKTALHERYQDCGVDAERIGKFAKAAGAKFHLSIVKDNTIRNNLDVAYLRNVGGSRATSFISRDYYIPYLTELLKSPSLELSWLIWQTLLTFARQPCSDCLLATYQLNRANGARHAPSRLIHDLRAAEWVPQGDDVFVRPADASRELLPEGFPFDPGYAFVKSIQFGETVVKATAQAMQQEATAKSVGFSDAAELERARRIMELMSEEEQEAFIAERENSRNLTAVPDRPLANPGRRAENIRDQAADAKGKESEIRPRSVSIGRENVKEQATAFLREHYRNANGDMTCQICKGPLPFNMDDGEGHFETVEFLPELKKRHPQNYIALCPNHSAMFRLVNHSLEMIREEFQAIEGNELSVVLAEKDLTIYFSRHHITELQAVLAVEVEISGAYSGERDR